MLGLVVVPAALPLAAPLAASPLREILPTRTEHVFALVLAVVQAVLSPNICRIGPGRASQCDRADGQGAEATEDAPPVGGGGYTLGEAIEASPFHENIPLAPPLFAACAMIATRGMATSSTPSWESSS